MAGRDPQAGLGTGQRPGGPGFEPNLPPPDLQGNTATTGGKTRLLWGPGGWATELLTQHLPAETPALANAVTDASSGAGGGPSAPAVVQVAARAVPWAGLVILGAVVAGGIIAWRWWQTHRKGAPRG